MRNVAARDALLGVLGTELPIIQAPMAGVQAAALAIAVSNAGALGSLPCALLTVEALRQELTQLRARTAQPYNVNFFCHRPPVPDAARERAWRESLAPYFRECGMDPDSIPAGPGRTSFDAEAAAVLEEFAPRVVSFHFGLPAPDLLARVKSLGSNIIASATTVDEARWLEARGADAIIAQGIEAGGHRGMFLTEDVAAQIGTFALVPQVVKAVRIPVIAAGGIADAAGAAAAMKLGAAGVQVGTAFLLCPESLTSALHRAALKSEAARMTVVTNVFTGRPARAIVNRLIAELGPINDRAPAFPLAAAAVMALRTRAEGLGRADFTPLWCGQNATGCRERPAADIVAALAEGTSAP
jgi:nitronate monooxygenase